MKDVRSVESIMDVARCVFSRLDEQPVKRVVELSSWEALGVVKVRAQLEGSESGQSTDLDGPSEQPPPVTI